MRDYFDWENCARMNKEMEQWEMVEGGPVHEGGEICTNGGQSTGPHFWPTNFSFFWTLLKLFTWSNRSRSKTDKIFGLQNSDAILRHLISSGREAIELTRKSKRTHHSSLSLQYSGFANSHNRVFCPSSLFLFLNL